MYMTVCDFEKSFSFDKTVEIKTTCAFLFMCKHIVVNTWYRTSDFRQRGHPFQLPDHYTDLHKKNLHCSISVSIYQIKLS